MSDLVSLRYLLSVVGSNDGIAPLDENGKLPITMLPAEAIGAFVGDYATLQALSEAHPTGTTGQYGTVAGVKYYWNNKMDPPQWNSIEIGVTDYGELTSDVINAQPEWLIVPDTV